MKTVNNRTISDQIDSSDVELAAKDEIDLDQGELEVPDPQSRQLFKPQLL